MKPLFSLLIYLVFVTTVDAQKLYSTNTGQVKIKSTTTLENFNAINDLAESRWLENNGQFFFTVFFKDFKFENASKEAEFFERFTENGKFPKAIFKGFIQDIQQLDLTSSGGNEINIDGILTIHGVTQKLLITGNLTVLSSGKIMLKSDLKIKWQDFNITPKEKSAKPAPECFVSIYCIYD
jgi:hypothetical protein